MQKIIQALFVVTFACAGASLSLANDKVQAIQAAEIEKLKQPKIPTDSNPTKFPGPKAVGEYQQAGGARTLLNSKEYSDGGSKGLLLEKGVWDLQAICIFEVGEKAVVTDILVNIATQSGNSDAGSSILGRFSMSAGISGVIVSSNPSYADLILSTPLLRVNIPNDSVQYYPKASAAFTGKTYANCTLTARRAI